MNFEEQLKEHHKKYGKKYRYFEDGQVKFARIKDEDLPAWLLQKGLTIKQPPKQPTLEQLKNNEWYL